MSVLTVREHGTIGINDCFACDGRKSITVAQADALERLSQRMKAAGLKGGIYSNMPTAPR